MAVYNVRCAPEWPGAARSCGGPGRSNASGHCLPTTLVYSWRDAIVFYAHRLYYSTPGCLFLLGCAYAMIGMAFAAVLFYLLLFVFRWQSEKRTTEALPIS